MRGSNLHTLWDTGLIRNMNEDYEQTAARLLTSQAPPQTRDLSVHAAEESCRIVSTPGFYPLRKVGLDYIARLTPLMERRLKVAGARLAGILNMVYR
jgi:hypothetical protein